MLAFVVSGKTCVGLLGITGAALQPLGVQKRLQWQFFFQKREADKMFTPLVAIKGTAVR